MIFAVIGFGAVSMLIGAAIHAVFARMVAGNTKSNSFGKMQINLPVTPAGDQMTTTPMLTPMTRAAVRHDHRRA
jgi:small-conductance mechanosensitive channel